MLKKLAETMPFESWIKGSSRFYRLAILNKILDGSLYDHLTAAFYDETSGPMATAQMIPLVQRRPSTPYNFIQMFAKESARKLFAGRHFPIIRSDDIKVDATIDKIISRGSVSSKMIQAAYLGSVGSVAIAFRVSPQGAIALDVWRSDWCTPFFDAFNNLVKLRVHYPATGADIIQNLKTTLDVNGKFLIEQVKHDSLDPRELYWVVQDIIAKETIFYHPISTRDWNPVTPNEELIGLYTIPNPGSILPAIWITNMGSMNGPDGECSWEIAANTAVEIDYTLSQIGRAVRYNAAPQLVVIGALEDDDDEGSVVRSPIKTLYVNAGTKNDDGISQGAGDAKLLEMTGRGIDAGLEYVDKLRKFALELVSASRKDLEQMHGPMSGRAMEMIDQEALDAVYELRSSYGDNGLMNLIRLILMVYRHYGLVNFDDGLLETLIIDWPKPYLATAGEAAQLGQAVLSFMQAQVLDDEELKNYLAGYLDLAALNFTGMQGDIPVSDAGITTGGADDAGKSDRSVMQTGPDEAYAAQQIIDDTPTKELRARSSAKQRRVADRQYRAKPDRWRGR